MTTLSYGFLLPASGDKGTALWNALQGDITQLNNHTHDGVNSAPIPGKNIASQTQSILAANWATYGGAPTGFYRQLVTMLAGYTFDANVVTFRDSTGKYVYPTVEKNDATSFYIYSTDNTLALTAMYGG